MFKTKVRMRWLSHTAILLGLPIVVFYGLVLLYLYLNQDSIAFIGANLDGGEHLVVTGRASVPWNTVRVTTDDGVMILLLESRLAEAPEAPWVIYFYGQAGQLADVKGCIMYELFRNVGLNVFAVEYRGYGASEKMQPTEQGIYADARAAWEHLSKNQNVPASRVILYGYSLGGAVAIQLATEIAPAGLITEGTFTSSLDWGSYHYPWLPTVLRRLVVQYRFENLEKARSLSLPWLLFHGRQDSMIPFSHAEALAATRAGERNLVPLECGHEDAVELEIDQMETALKEFVGELFGLDNGT